MIPESDRAALKQNFRGIIFTLLTRMQTSKTDQYVYYFVYFLSFCLAINVTDFTPDYVVGELEGIQPGCVITSCYKELKWLTSLQALGADAHELHHSSRAQIAV